jgi:hypothetical protein
MPTDRPPNPRTPDDDSFIQGGNWFSRKLEAFLGEWTPPCTEMTHLISEQMDHPLPWFTRFKMRTHFLICCYCKRYQENLQYLRQVFQQLARFIDHPAEGEIPPEAKTQMKQVLRDESNSR